MALALLYTVELDTQMGDSPNPVQGIDCMQAFSRKRCDGLFH